ncbi:MAG: 30S ribosomal protein S6 [Spirochaetia bacterium]|nr:30S ribosomal protein S6 [Spirochaetia bacterium]
MRKYEIITIFQEGTDVQESKKSLNEIFERNSVQVSSEEDWGVRKLPHLLKKKGSGFYSISNCEMDPAKVKDVTHEILIQQSILHHMVKAL